MSPLVSTPNRGYSDYQRIANYDGSPLWAGNFGPTHTPSVSPVLDVSRFAYIGGYVQENADYSLVQVAWSTAASPFIGTLKRTFVLAHDILQPAQVRLQNLGPFAQVSITPVTVSNYFAAVSLFGTNRVDPVELVPVNPVVIDQQAIAIGVSASAIIYPFDYFAGPAMLAAYIGQAGALYIEYLTPQNTWDTIYNIVLAAATQLNTMVVLPLGAWRIIISNGAVAATVYNLAITPSLTGAS